MGQIYPSFFVLLLHVAHLQVLPERSFGEIKFSSSWMSSKAFILPSHEVDCLLWYKVWTENHSIAGCKCLIAFWFIARLKRSLLALWFLLTCEWLFASLSLWKVFLIPRPLLARNRAAHETARFWKQVFCCCCYLGLYLILVIYWLGKMCYLSTKFSQL